MGTKLVMYETKDSEGFRAMEERKLQEKLDESLKNSDESYVKGRNPMVQLTLQEAVDMIRESGISMSLDALKQGIIQKELPIGHAIRLTQWVFIIYRKQLVEYLKTVGAVIPREEG
jgi:hypothetical protein